MRSWLSLTSGVARAATRRLCTAASSSLVVQRDGAVATIQLCSKPVNALTLQACTVALAPMAIGGATWSGRPQMLQQLRTTLSELEDDPQVSD